MNKTVCYVTAVLGVPTYMPEFKKWSLTVAYTSWGTHYLGTLEFHTEAEAKEVSKDYKFLR